MATATQSLISLLVSWLMKQSCPLQACSCSSEACTLDSSAHEALRSLAWPSSCWTALFDPE